MTLRKEGEDPSPALCFDGHRHVSPLVPARPGHQLQEEGCECVQEFVRGDWGGGVGPAGPEGAAHTSAGAEAVPETGAAAQAAEGRTDRDGQGHAGHTAAAGGRAEGWLIDSLIGWLVN